MSLDTHVLTCASLCKLMSHLYLLHTPNFPRSVGASLFHVDILFYSGYPRENPEESYALIMKLENVTCRRMPT